MLVARLLHSVIFGHEVADSYFLYFSATKRIEPAPAPINSATPPFPGGLHLIHKCRILSAITGAGMSSEGVLAAA